MLGARARLGRGLPLPRAGPGLAASRRYGWVSRLLRPSPAPEGPRDRLSLCWSPVAPWPPLLRPPHSNLLPRPGPGSNALLPLSPGPFLGPFLP